MSHKLINDHPNPLGKKDGCLIRTLARATPPVHKYCSLNAWYRSLINVMLCLSLVWYICHSQAMQMNSCQNEFCHARECYVWQPPMVQSTNTPQSFSINHTNNIVKIIITTTKQMNKIWKLNYESNANTHNYTQILVAVPQCSHREIRQLE